MNITQTQLQTLSLAADGGILTICINRPEVLNALNAAVLAELKQVFGLIAAEEAVKGIIITGSGHKAFAAGADISEINSLDKTGAYHFSKNGQEIFQSIEDCTKPVIAAVNGFALGGGCELAMACHLRVAAENAKFGQPEVNLGLIAGYGGTQRLPKLIGRTKALELLLTADVISATQALELGLVNHVTTQDELLGKAAEILHKILLKSPLAITETIKSVNNAGTNKGYETELNAFTLMAVSQDGKEGTKAFLEKRKPLFTGK